MIAPHDGRVTTRPVHTPDGARVGHLVLAHADTPGAPMVDAALIPEDHQ